MRSIHLRIAILSLISFLLTALTLPDFLAAQQDSSSQNMFLQVPGAKLYYEQCGSGQALVLLHDGLLSSATWDNIWVSLCSKFHVIRYDRRGFGQSDSPQAPFSPTADLLAVFQHLNLQSAVLVGNSSGGAVALDFALEYPQMVEGLFLIGPVLHGMQPSEFFIQRGEENNEPLQRGDTRAAAENWSKDRFLFGPRQNAARTQFLEALTKSPKSLKYSASLEQNLSPPAARRLEQLHAPVFLLLGEFDIGDVYSFSGAIQNGVTESTRVIVEEAGHVVQLEKPDVVFDRVTRFTQRVTRKIVKVPASVLASFAGRYALGGSEISVTSVGNYLILEVPGLQSVPFYPESNTSFFAKAREIDIEFKQNIGGQTVQMDLHQGGAVVKCPRR
jgi:3-oxoadipate enol-lactonase